MEQQKLMEPSSTEARAPKKAQQTQPEQTKQSSKAKLTQNRREWQKLMDGQLL
jgi:hypothetical protein